MHHFLYPTKDTFITNRNDYEDKNFGIDEILGVGTKNTPTRVWLDTKEYHFSNTYVSNQSVDAFSGTASVASFSGDAEFISGSISASGSIIEFSTDYFSGVVIASLAGTDMGVPLLSFNYSGSLTSFSGSIITYTSGSTVNTASFTGSWDSASIAWDSWASLWNWNAVAQGSGIIHGAVFGSISAECQQFFTYNGGIVNLDGIIHYGFISGKEFRHERNSVVSTIKYPNRSLLQFNITSISASIAKGEIATPNFTLNLRVAKEEELPIQYKVYAFAINQSWEMGNGYYYDGGSDEGCNWNYKDSDGGTRWYSVSTASTGIIDFVTHPEQATASWAKGGGTWYTSSAYICSQSFDYETSDIVMDVSRIVLGWLSGSISNHGIILISSDEFASTGSQFDLSFFSRDTNTVYSPYLDAGWDDTSGSWSTGSVTLVSTTNHLPSGSVNLYITNGYLLSGSSNIISGSNGVNISASLSGSFGLCHPASIVGGVISGEVTAIATSGPFTGVTITGNISGAYNSGSINGTFTSGQLVGCDFTGSSWPMPTPYTTGSSFLATATGSYQVSGSSIIGITNDQGIIIAVIAGYLVTGNITGSYSNGQFLGLIQNGWATGYYVSASVAGTYITSSANTASYYTSHSLEALQTNVPFVVVVQNVPSTVKANNIIRVNVFGREEFPLKNFTRATQLTQFLTPKYLPTSSYYALKDNETEQIVQDFDNYTKINCDENGNYFLLDTSCLPQERYFRILIKVEHNGSIYTMDHGNVFKVVR